MHQCNSSATRCSCQLHLLPRWHRSWERSAAQAPLLPLAASLTECPLEGRYVKKRKTSIINPEEVKKREKRIKHTLGILKYLNRAVKKGVHNRRLFGALVPDSVVASFVEGYIPDWVDDGMPWSRSDLAADLAGGNLKAAVQKFRYVLPSQIQIPFFNAVPKFIDGQTQAGFDTLLSFIPKPWDGAAKALVQEAIAGTFSDLTGVSIGI